MIARDHLKGGEVTSALELRGPLTPVDENGGGAGLPAVLAACHRRAGDDAAATTPGRGSASTTATSPTGAPKSGHPNRITQADGAEYDLDRPARRGSQSCEDPFGAESSVGEDAVQVCFAHVENVTARGQGFHGHEGREAVVGGGEARPPVESIIGP